MIDKKPVCIIPARSGSKRLKNKNIIKVLNIPVIAYVIKTALSSKLFSKVIVTTDDKRIAAIAKKNGALVPFIRDKKLSGSLSSIKDTLRDCIKKIKSFNTKYHFCIYPTAILLTKKDLQKAFSKIKKSKADALIAVVENKSFYRSLIYNTKSKQISYKWKKFSKTMSQNLPKAFLDSGTFYIFKTTKYLSSESNIPKKTISYVVDKYKGIDVNTKEDIEFLKIAKEMY